MKKILLLSLACVLLFSLFSCHEYKKSSGTWYFYNPSFGDKAASFTPSPLQLQNEILIEDTTHPFNTEDYSTIVENTFLPAKDNPLSTFSIDVDAASYSNVRRFINSNQIPPRDAIRIEEMINYFDYEYPQPEGSDPFSVTNEYTSCPWNTDHRMILIGLQGKNIKETEMPKGNFVFLVDVSGSMNEPDKLPLLQIALRMLVEKMREQDKIAIVTYAGNAGLALPSTPGSEKEKILRTIDRLTAGGSTAGSEGINLAYKIAAENFITGGNNRVILATDGDFNVGVSSDAELVQLIERQRKSGVFLSVLGFGTGNYKDNKMEQLADKGNGNYSYIDRPLEARKVLVDEMSGTLFTIAKDVKIQVEFNPAQVKAYRLIGYENRLLKKEDFNNDTKDAGEMGAGQEVTALYEIIPAGSSESVDVADNLRYQTSSLSKNAFSSGEVMTIKLRYKKPDEDSSKLMVKTLKDEELTASSSRNFLFASSVAEYCLLLRNSEYKESSSYDQVIQNASAALSFDPEGYRVEFVRMVQSSVLLAGK